MVSATAVAPEFFGAQLTRKSEWEFPSGGVVGLVVVMQLALGPKRLVALSSLFVLTLKQLQVVPAKAHVTPELVLLRERFVALGAPDVTGNPVLVLPVVFHRCLLIVTIGTVTMATVMVEVTQVILSIMFPNS